MLPLKIVTKMSIIKVKIRREINLIEIEVLDLSFNSQQRFKLFTLNTLFPLGNMDARAFYIKSPCFYLFKVSIYLSLPSWRLTFRVISSTNFERLQEDFKLNNHDALWCTYNVLC